MSAESLNYGHSPEAYRAPLRLVERQGLPQTELEALVSRFDTNWREEGLPQDWYRLRGVGFNIEAEMKVLTDKSIPIVDRAVQSERNLLGFKVEYLDQSVSVFPVEYETRIGADGTYLYDKRYKASMISTVSADERKGSAREALLDVESFMLSAAPVGSMAVMTSPEGPTGAPDGSDGLKDNNGQQIRYPDSYWFVFQKKAEGKVSGFGLRTDSTVLECREVIRRLTGKELPIDAPLEDYVRQVALISPNSEVSSIKDVMDVLRTSRAPDRQVLIDKKNSWEKAYSDTQRGEQLYDLDAQGKQIIEEYRVYVSTGGRSDLEIQKALAATVLRLSKLYLFDQKQTGSGERYLVRDNIIYPDRFTNSQEVSFGHTLNEVKKIEGCAGGGENANSVQSIIDRQGMALSLGEVSGLPLEKDMYGKRWFKCENCDGINIRPKDQLLKNCKHCEKPVNC